MRPSDPAEPSCDVHACPYAVGQMLGEDGKSWLAKHFEIIGQPHLVAHEREREILQP
jgi:hypothetical protein